MFLNIDVDICTRNSFVCFGFSLTDMLIGQHRKSNPEQDPQK